MQPLPRIRLASRSARHLLASASTVLAFAVTACAPDAAVDPSASEPSASTGAFASSSVGSTVDPSPSASAAAVLATDSIGRVVVTDLVVRSAPGVGDDSRILEMGLTDGDLVYVVAGPVSADGYDWLLVTQLAPSFASRAAGWIAPASREGEEWVKPMAPDCPAEVSVEAFASVPQPLLLYCFGGQELTLEGVYGSCAHGDPVIQEPEWLANNFCIFEMVGRPEGESDWPSMEVHTDPAAAFESDGAAQAVRITGRFDSPLAETCRFMDEAAEIMPELGETDELFLRFNCRAAFVVESATPMDP